MTRQAVRAIVLNGDKLLVMHRNKFGTEYDTLPGGGITPGETKEHAVVRELFEETSITVNNLKLVFIEQAGDPFGTQYVYLCDYLAGEPKLSDASEEARINKLGQNLYEPRWVSVAQLPQLPFMSEHLKSAIIQAVQDGFPAEPKQIR